MTQHQFQRYTPSLNSLCLCGSNKKFKRCCAPNYKGRKPGRSPKIHFENGDFKSALVECRADITQYTIWHKIHTEPALRAGVSGVLPLMNIDIRAMGDLVDNLFYCYQNLDSVDEFPQVLERLRNNINDERWHRKITYFHALFALWPNWDKRAGKRELKRLGSIDGETDPEILQLYIDLFGDELSFSRKIALSERAVEISEKRVDTLHYRGLKATQYLLVGDKAKAETEFDEAISNFRAGGTDDLTAYESYRFATSLEWLAEVSGNASLFDEALAVLERSLDTDELNRQGRADMLRSIGDIQRLKGEWLEALDCYERAIELDALSIYEVFASECLLHLERPEAAQCRLLQTDLDQLSPSERADYAFTFAAVAVETGSEDVYERAEQQLDNLTINEPLFRERRDNLLLELLKSRDMERKSGLGAKTRLLLRELLNMSRRYLILQPNVMGIGIDLEKIADDISNGTDMHERERGKRRGGAETEQQIEEK